MIRGFRWKQTNAICSHFEAQTKPTLPQLLQSCLLLPAMCLWRLRRNLPSSHQTSKEKLPHMAEPQSAKEANWKIIKKARFCLQKRFYFSYNPTTGPPYTEAKVFIDITLKPLLKYSKALVAVCPVAKMARFFSNFSKAWCGRAATNDSINARLLSKASWKILEKERPLYLQEPAFSIFKVPTLMDASILAESCLTPMDWGLGFWHLRALLNLILSCL